MKPQVLIVGAGPTGLVLAIALIEHRVPFRIIDKNKGPGEASRAMGVHARTLEFYRQLGFANEVVNQGIPLGQVYIHEGTKVKAQMSWVNIGEGLSPYPYMLSFPQDDHERLLVQQLEARGVSIDWNTELASFSDEGDHVRAVLKQGDIVQEEQYLYLCGCDGVRSSVRKGLDLGFPGGTYEQLFYVADVECESQVEGMHMSIYDKGFCSFMPLRTRGLQRLIGIVPMELLDNNTTIGFEEIRPYVEKYVGLRVKTVNWFSTYHVHHRVSDSFRKGRVFIAGDAGHVHSPAGGQGMNTGIGDAVNLSWKLAAVLHGKADESVLDTYEAERIAFARVLVSTTDTAFQNVIGDTLPGKIIRGIIIPYVLPFMFGFSSARKTVFKTVSQTRIQYRDSELSSGKAGNIHGGDRLPWVQTAGSDNFEPLKSLNWQLHVYGQAKQLLRDFAKTSGFSLHEFPWTSTMKDSGLKQDSLYLIRPDGYVGLADTDQDVEKITAYLHKFKLSPLYNKQPHGE